MTFVNRIIPSSTLLVMVFLSSLAVGQGAPPETSGTDREESKPLTSKAQGATSDLLDQYRDQELTLRFQWFKGVELYRAGKPAGLGFFGGNAREIFRDSTQALDAMGTYRSMRIAGFAMWATGLAALVTELVLLVNDRNLFIETKATGKEDFKPLFWGLLVPALVVGVSGAVVMQGANGYLSDAVEHFNHDLQRRLRDQGAVGIGAPSLGITLRGSF